MSDLISRQSAIERIEAEYQAWGDEYNVRQILGDLEDLPSAQPEHEYTMEEFVYGQDMGNPEDGSL